MDSSLFPNGAGSVKLGRFLTTTQKRGVRDEIYRNRVADIAKNVFHVYGITEDGEIVKKALRRKQVLEYFAQIESGVVGLESCGSAHYRARELAKLGHEAKLINPRLVNPYGQRGTRTTSTMLKRSSKR